MKDRRHISHYRRVSVFAAGFALVLAGLAPVASAGETKRTPSSRPLPSITKPVNPPAPPPAPAPSKPDVGSPSPSPGGGGGGRRHSHGYHPYPRHHHRHGYGYGYGFGFYGYGYHWPYYRFYADYRYPYYPWGLVWYPAYSSDTRLGALDLSVKPKKTEVYVDGQYVGNSGKFDGYPGYLWLTEGSHQLVFYREGWETVERRVSVRSGPVRALRLTLREGPSRAPEELFEPPPQKAEVKETERPQARPAPRATERTERAELDLRGEPGRFRLEIAPPDASVYLDGRFLGSAEELSRLHAGMMVEAGEHFIDVQRPGYETERVRFAVEPGDETEVRVDLSASETPGD